ncbi:hypothetical protein ACQPZA_01270 [Pseudonocardia xinjiangensis]|uniref:hypothetical protein n=1 Tax=Pseudonocardia xinjiangensis TaxID=75289 RepID=UPI003D8E2752
MGFVSKEDLWRGEGRRLREALDHGEPLTRPQWWKALLATEIVFSSTVVGAGWDWTITTGLPDEETIKLLREVQRKLARALRIPAAAEMAPMGPRRRLRRRGPDTLAGHA